MSDQFYEFGPREQGGLFSMLSLRQTVSAGLTVALAFIALRFVPSGANLFTAAVVGAGGFFITTFPVNGRPVVDWFDIVARHLVRRSTGRTTFRSAAPGMGHVLRADGEVEQPIDLPPQLDSIEILGVPWRDAEVGVAYDNAIGCYTATLLVTATQFALLDEDEQVDKLGGWSAVLADLARDDSPITRLQWVERTLPAKQDEMLEYLNEARDPDIALDSAEMRSYLALQSHAASVQQEHELLLTLRIDKGSRRVRKMAGRLGRGDEGYCQLLLREINAFYRALEHAQVEVIGVLTPEVLARTLRGGIDPFSALADKPEGISPALIGPMASETKWDHLEADGTLSVTYWIAEWPRIGVGPTFLSPLLLNTNATRSIGVTMEPVAPLKAMRDAEAAATAQEADEDMRQRKGFRTGAKSRKQHGAVLQREAELANGHAEVRFAGFITVSARDEHGLENACAQIEHAAGQARLELCRLSGEQDDAITFTMPLARGLSTGAF